MKSNLMKKMMAVATATTLVLSTLTFSFAAEAPVTESKFDEAWTVTGDIESYVYSVTLSTDTEFALDPYEAAADRLTAFDSEPTNVAPGQIYGDYVVNNASDFPVRVTYEMKATGAAKTATSPAVLFVDDRTLVEPDNLEVATKNVYFGVIGASETDGSGVATYDQVSDTSGSEYDDVDAAAIIFEPSSDKSKATGKFTIILDDSDETNGVQEGAFSFYAELDTYAPWKTGDITISGTYTLTGLKPSTIVALAAGDSPGGVELVATDYTLAKHQFLWPAAPASASDNATKSGFVVSSGKVAATHEVTYSKASAADIKVPFIAPYDTVGQYTAFTTAKIGAGAYATTDVEFVVDQVDTTKSYIVLKKGGKLVSAGTVNSAAASPYSLTIAFGTNTYTLDIRITQ